MRRFLAGLIVGFFLVPLGLFFYFLSGMAPVSTASRPMAFEKMLAHRALEAHIEKEAPKNAPIQPDQASYEAGAQVYREHCGVCHGYATGTQTAIAKGMFPKPPRLLQGTGVTDDEPGETYWKVANGIRLTGMPGFRQSLSETQMWQVSLLLANADKLPDTVKQGLTAESQAQNTSSVSPPAPAAPYR
ncbi:MAG TPA: c-type cytochrome [Terriglobales bacterium]|nr:c-type cytochrome [Terriglobales bacterium]